MNMLTGIDANSQNFTLMYTICGTENEVNWNSTISRVATMLDNDIDVFVSDRDKGLLAVTKKMKESDMVDCVFTACVLHLAKNAGITKAEAITVVTKMAKAPNEEAFEKHLKELKTLCSAEAVNYMVERKILFAVHAINANVLKLSDGGKFFTNYGQSSSNASEQQNNAFKSFRDMPYVTGLITFLRDYFRKILDRRTNAEMMLHQQMEVVDRVGAEALQNAKQMLLSKWQYQPVDIVRRNDGSILSVTFNVFKKITANNSCGGLQNFQHQVGFYPTERDWHNRIKCACGYFEVFGKPCYHAAFLLNSLHSSKKTTTLKSVRDIIGMQTWSPLWYSDIYLNIGVEDPQDLFPRVTEDGEGDGDRGKRGERYGGDKEEEGKENKNKKE